MTNNNKYNLFLFDNFELLFEKKYQIEHTNNFRTRNLLDERDVRQVYSMGRDHKNNERIQRMEHIPLYLCNIGCPIFSDKEKIQSYKYLFSINQRGYGHVNFCRNFCPEFHRCKFLERHNYFFKELYKEIDKSNTLNVYLPKAYITFPDVMKYCFNDLTIKQTLWEESIFNYIYEQTNISPTWIHRYNKIIGEVIMRREFRTELGELWKDLHDLMIRHIYTDITSPSLTTKKKINNINKHLEEFLDRLGTKPIAVLQDWNNTFKETLLDYKFKKLLKVSNLMNSLIKISDNFYKMLKKGTMNCFFTIDDLSNALLFYQDNRALIRNIFKNSFTIINDASITQARFKAPFPEYFDDDKDMFKWIINKEIKMPWQQVHILNKDKGKGIYAKFTLIDLIRSKIEGRIALRNEFNSLIGHTKNILPYELNRNNRYKVVLIAFQDLIPFIEKALLNLVEELKEINDQFEIKYLYWYNLLGIDSYKDFHYAIVFGAPGLPKVVIQSLSKLLNIAVEELQTWSTEDQIMQGIERLRSILFPYLKVAYLLTNVLKNKFENEVNFTGILELEHKKLLDWMRTEGWVNNKRIMEFSGFKEKKTSNLMKALLEEGLIKKREYSDGVGRPKDLWASV